MFDTDDWTYLMLMMRDVDWIMVMVDDDAGLLMAIDAWWLIMVWLSDILPFDGDEGLLTTHTRWCWILIKADDDDGTWQ